jgi:hypothetical protein
MNNQAMTRDEDMVKFSKNPKDKMDKGFLIERNDKLPLLYCLKGIKVNHNRNFIFSCVTLGLWSIP